MTPKDYWTGWLLFGAAFCVFEVAKIVLLYLIWKQ